MIHLRPYQEAARQANLDLWNDGTLSILDVLATGCGKTEIFLATLEAEFLAGRMTRALIIAHREELIAQPVERIKKNWKGLPTPGVVMGSINESNAQIVVATVQTLKNQKRLDDILRHGTFSHLIIDEAHHGVATTYTKVVDRLRMWNSELRVLGVTATPKRTDKSGLSKIFDKVAYRVGITDAVKFGALVPFTAMAAEIPVSLDSIDTSGNGDDSDWNQEQLGAVLACSNVEELVIETWRKYASGRPTIAFTASVAQAVRLASAFKAAGLAFEAVSAETDKTFRRQVVEDLKSGKIQGIVNCAIFTEGTDIPNVSCILQVKPTKSDSLYCQMVGRGLRLFPGKSDALIIDFVPADARDMVMAADLLGKPKAQRKRESKAREKGVILDVFGIDSEGNGIDGDPDEIITRVLDYFSGSHLAWTFDGGLASVTAGYGKTIAVVLPQQARIEAADKIKAAGQWNPKWDTEYEKICSYQVFSIVDGVPELLGNEDSWDSANIIAEEWMTVYGSDQVLSKKKSKWRNDPAKPKQVELCRKLKVWQDGMSSGQAAQAITHALAKSCLKKNGILK